MGLEAGNFIEDLVQANPIGGLDPKSEGDDHLRLLKVCIQGSFPGGAGAWNFPDQDPNFRDLDARKIVATGDIIANTDLQVVGDILTNKQVAFASGTFDGSNANLVFTNYGITATTYDGVGEYSLQLSEAFTEIENLGISITPDFIVGSRTGQAALVDPRGGTTANRWIGINTANSNGQAADAFLVYVTFWNAARV